MPPGTRHAQSPAPPAGAGNLAGLLTAASERWPHRCALVHNSQQLTYAELDRRSQQAAAYLAGRGVTPGDRVGLQAPNSFAFASLYFGILRLGAIVVPQNPLATPRETDVALSDASAKLLLTEDDARQALGSDTPLYADLQPVAPDDTAVILYTSGTTGTPKGAELTHANLGRNAQAAVDIYAFTIDDVVLGVLPLYHSYGQTCTLNGAIAVGARVVLESRFDANRVAEAIQAHAVTVLLGVPTMFSDLAYCDADERAFASLRLCSCGGAPLPREVLEAFEARTHRPLYETYGLSETSPIASFNGRDGTRRPGTAGWPIRGTEMKIAGPTGDALAPGEIGQIAIRGHNIMKGYWHNPAATREAIDADGWFYSGDLGAVDEDGAFRIVGRLKEMIIRGGLNIYPRELEDLLHQHPAVRATAVVGVPDQRLGEEVGAAVVLEPDATATTAELREWMKARVAPHKYPRHIWFVHQLPKGPTGKILKREITPPAGVAANPAESRAR
jgi:long-chain acyl-CoA synthetase